MIDGGEIWEEAVECIADGRTYCALFYARRQAGSGYEALFCDIAATSLFRERDPIVIYSLGTMKKKINPAFYAIFWLVDEIRFFARREVHR